MLDEMNFIWETSDEYHRQSRNGECLSSHALMKYIKNPFAFLWSLQHPATDTPSFFFGRAVHTKILETSLFDEQYAIGGPINEKTGKPYGTNTQKFQDWASLQADKGKVCISDSDNEIITQAFNSVKSHDIAQSLLSKGFAESVVRTDYCGHKCQIRMDWFNNEKEVIVDLKTTRNLDRFTFDFRDYQYANQLSFYQQVFRSQFGFEPECYIIAVEVSEPYRTGVFRITSETLAIAKEQNEIAIPKFFESKTSGVYPTLYEEMRAL